MPALLKSLLGWTVWLICLLVADAQAKPADAQAKPQEAECLFSTDFHIVHLSAFQPGERKENAFQRYCQELPRPGLTYLGIDFMERDARRMPIALAVVEEDAQGRVQRTLAELAPRTYPQGVATIQVNLDHAGQYVALVRFQDEVGDELRIPLKVAERAALPWPAIALGGGIAGFLGLGLVGYYVWRRR